MTRACAGRTVRPAGMRADAREWSGRGASARRAGGAPGAFHGISRFCKTFQQQQPRQPLKSWRPLQGAPAPRPNPTKEITR